MKKAWNIRKLANCLWCVSFAKRLLSNIKFTTSSYLLFIAPFKIYFQIGKLSQYPLDILSSSRQYIAGKSANYPDNLNDYAWVNRNDQTDNYHYLKRSLSWKEAARLFFNKQVFTVLFIDGGFPKK